jgi:hypothetical protein
MVPVAKERQPEMLRPDRECKCRNGHEKCKCKCRNYEISAESSHLFRRPQNIVTPTAT